MEFDLPCECRKVHRVSIGLAGTSIPCECAAEQSRLRALLRRMPEYDDLFRKYPRATIQF
jgi:hypothetical protein